MKENRQTGVRLGEGVGYKCRAPEKIQVGKKHRARRGYPDLNRDRLKIKA